MHSNLPHINQKHMYQFITFRTKESTDSFINELLSNSNLKTKNLQHEIDNYLDNSNNGAYLNDDIRDLTKKYLLNIDEKLCKIVSFSIMPNHIHILLIQYAELSEILRHIKGGLSYTINKNLGRTGALWQKDYFDKVIRDEEHFKVTYNYIKNNAIKANLKDAEKRFYSIYE